MTAREPAKRFSRPLSTHFYHWALEAGSQFLKPLLADRLDSVRVESDVPYGPNQYLDLYFPRAGAGKWPFVFYLHGGGFCVCSKESHWMFGAEFARRGYAVVMPNYRLAPEHPFPAGLQDVFAAWEFVLDHASPWNLDLSRAVVAGESAGANLSLGLLLSTVAKREETYARPLYERKVVPKAVIAACGALGVSTFEPGPELGTFVANRLRNIQKFYVGGVSFSTARELELVDPLVALESPRIFERPLPPIFIPCGEKDPLLPDSKRLADALSRRREKHQLTLYAEEGHAFHALLYKAQAQACWEDTLKFLEACDT